MGGNISNHASLADEDDHVTFVKGIRLTDKVIQRMREERQAIQKIVHTHSEQDVPAPQLSTETTAPTVTPAPTDTPAPTVDRLVPLLVDPPPSAQPSSLPLPAHPVKLTPPPPVTFVAAPPAKPTVQASAFDSKAPAPPVKAMGQPPTVESAASPEKSLAPTQEVESPAPPPPVQPMTQASAVESAAPPLPKEPVVLATPPVSPIEPSATSVETNVLPQVAEHTVLSPVVEPGVISTPPQPFSEAVVPPPLFVDATVLSSVDEPVVLATPGLVERVFVPTPVEPTVPTSVLKATVVEPAVFSSPRPVVPPLKVAPPPVDVVLPKPPPVEPLTVYSLPEPAPLPAPVVGHTPEPVVETLQAQTWQSMELATRASTANEQPDASPPPRVEPVDPPPRPASEEEPLPLLVEDVAVPIVAPAWPAPPPTALEEAELRRQIRAELTKDLEEEMERKRQELQKHLDEVRAAARVQAQAQARLQVQEEVQKIRSLEEAAQSDDMKAAIAKERMTPEDETLMAQLYALQWIELKSHKLEEKEKQLKKQDVLYREQIARLEEKSAQFFKVTTDNFRKGREDVHNTFKRVDIKPVCGDLQGRILQCYRENRGQTLACSGLANIYMQCVDGHKKTKSTGG